MGIGGIQILRKNLQQLTLQRQIVESLGIERRPNLTATHLREAENIRRTYSRITGVNPRAAAVAAGMEDSDHHQRQQTRRHFHEHQSFSGNTARRYTSLMPTCSAASSEDEEIMPMTLRMQFNCEMFDSSNARTVRVLSASLRLKKKPQPSGVTAMDGSENQLRSTGFNGNSSDHVMSDTQSNGSSNLRISLYSIRRSSTRRGINRRGSTLEMKRQIRSMLVRSDYTGWVRMNIRSTIEDWVRHGQTSGTIEVVVTDARRQLAVDALQVFEPRNCSYAPSVESLVLLPLSIADAEALRTGNSENAVPSSMTSQSEHSLDLPADFAQPYIELVTSSESPGAMLASYSTVRLRGRSELERRIDS